MIHKVQRLLTRLSEVEELLGHPEALSDQKQYRELTQEHAYLSELKEVWERFQMIQKGLEENRALLTSEHDSEMIGLLKEEIARLEAESVDVTKKIEILLVPPDPRDSRNIILELRAGTGGDEAALFVGDCVRMYQYYATKKGWKSEILSTSESEIGGYKEYIMSLSGTNVFRLMQFEAGTHRVQRVPATETQGPF
jgi:peptide chain release factor 1